MASKSWLSCAGQSQPGWQGWAASDSTTSGPVKATSLRAVWEILPFLCCSRIITPATYLFIFFNFSYISGQMPLFFVVLGLELRFAIQILFLAAYHSIKSWSSGFNYQDICLQLSWFHFRVWLSLPAHRHWLRLIFVKFELSFKEPVLSVDWPMEALDFSFGRKKKKKNQTRFSYLYL